jgi:hypothetical protein
MALGTDGDFAVVADADAGLLAPDVGPPRAVWRGADDGTFFCAGLLVGGLGCDAEFAMDLCLVVHSSADLGVLHLVQSAAPGEVLASTTAANPELPVLRHSFQSSDGSRIQYEINAARDRWVIQKVNGRPVDRHFDGWPMIEGSGIN